MPAGAFGAVRPVGAIPPTATAAAPPIRSHGRLRRSDGPLIFDPLGKCYPVLHADNQ